MNISLTDKDLSKVEKQEIEKLLERQNHKITDDLEQMWYLMDLVWDDYKCDNKNLDWNKIGKFYSHPVWTLNGLFIEQHQLSTEIRHVISDWVVNHGYRNIVDYGGGFGTLARLIAEKDENTSVDIYEPHPSTFGLKRINKFKNIRIIDKLENEYDCLVCTDVLEHVPDPLSNFSTMIKCIKVNGHLLIGNCFVPVIKCHLPQTFHLFFTFDLFAKIMGLEVVGKLEGSHATIYKKVKDVSLDWNRIRFYEKLSKLFSKIFYPGIVFLWNYVRPIKTFLIKTLKKFTRFRKVSH